MMTTLEQEIRSKLADLVAGQLSLSSFHEWLAPVIWGVEDQKDPGAAELVYSIELAIAEYTAGYRTFSYLIKELERRGWIDLLCASISTEARDIKSHTER